jgi:hypothetical protein
MWIIIENDVINHQFRCQAIKVHGGKYSTIVEHGLLRVRLARMEADTLTSRIGNTLPTAAFL